MNVSIPYVCNNGNILLQILITSYAPESWPISLPELGPAMLFIKNQRAGIMPGQGALRVGVSLLPLTPLDCLNSFKSSLERTM